MGGIVIWASVFITVFCIWVLQILFPETFFGTLNFLSRSQTWLPLTALGIGALVGFVDDYLVVEGTGRHFAGGPGIRHRKSDTRSTGSGYCGFGASGAIFLPPLRIGRLASA